MPNPLDDAFAEAESARIVARRMEEERRRLAERAARDWIEEYQDVLAAFPRQVSDSPREMTVAWPSRVDSPAAIPAEGEDPKAELVFGVCNVWVFGLKTGFEKGSAGAICVPADCTSVFKTKPFGTSVSTRRRLRGKSTWAQQLGPFIDVSTGLHTLELRSYCNPVGEGYYVSSSNLPSANQFAQIVAGIEVDSMPTIHWR